MSATQSPTSTTTTTPRRENGESTLFSRSLNDFLNRSPDSTTPIQISRLEERSCSIRYKNPGMDVLVAYGACKKNQNQSSPTPVLDGCMEFSSGSASASFKGERNCEACGCHRSFHERIILMRDQNGAISCASQMVIPEMGSSRNHHHQANHHQGTTTHHQQHHQHQQSHQTHHHGNANELVPHQHQQHHQQLLDLGSYYSKRRKVDELPEEPYQEFIRSSAIVQQQQHPIPLQSIELIEERSSWICDADKEKLLQGGVALPMSMKSKPGSTNGNGNGNGEPMPVPPEKLASFFERLQKEHPESPLKLEFVDGSWRVLCGVCARYLRADKKGETLHNIQKQHFVTPKHLSNLKAKLEAPDEMEFWLKRMAKLREKRAQQRSQPRYITAS